MPLSPEDVERQTFKERFKGYDMDEVDAFLDRVVERLSELVAETNDLRRQLDGAQASSGESERLLQRTLITAQRTADQTIADAQAEAEEILAAARKEAAADRERLQAEGQQLADTIEELKRFRDGYLAKVTAVIEEQLASLEAASSLPEVPSSVEDLAERARAVATDDVDAHLPPEGPVGRSALDADPPRRTPVADERDDEDTDTDARAGER